MLLPRAALQRVCTTDEGTNVKASNDGCIDARNPSSMRSAAAALLGPPFQQIWDGATLVENPAE